MQNLEQLRAAAALGQSQDLSRPAVSKLPALILQNGFLAAAAFCDAEGGGEGRTEMRRALAATAKHLAALGLVAPKTESARDIIRDLSQCDSQQLQRVTTEALAYLAYLKRFAPPKDRADDV